MSLLAESGLDAAFWADVERHVLRYSPAGVPVVVERAEGTVLHSTDGRRILDFTSGQMSSILGHGHPAITATLREAAGTLDHLFSGMLSRPVVELSRQLAESLPDPLEKVLLLTTGAESNEAALRLAKLVTGGHEVVAFSRSWHGMTLGAAAATYSGGRRGYGPVAPGNFVLPTPDCYRPDVVGADGSLDWRRQLELGFAMVDAQSTGALAACIVEPILSAARGVVPPPRYFPAPRRLRRAAGPLPRPRDAADLRRGADRAVPDRRLVRVRARRCRAGHRHAVEDPRCRPAAGGRGDERGARGARARARLPVLHDACLGP